MKFNNSDLQDIFPYFITILVSGLVFLHLLDTSIENREKHQLEMQKVKLALAQYNQDVK